MGRVLWMVNHYAGLPTQAGGTRHYWLSRGLQDLGWDVRLLRSGPSARRRPWHPSVEDVGGLEVTTIPGLLNDVRGLQRIRSWVEFSGWLQDPRSTRHLPKPDLVLGSTVHLGAAWSARGLARRHGAPFVFEIRDLWPETLIALGALKRNSMAAEGMLRLERSLVRSAALVVSPLSRVGQYLEDRHGISASRFVWVSNGVNTKNYSDLPQPPLGRLRIQYFGAIGTANDVATIIEAVSQANGSLGEPILLQVRGSGPDLDRLAKRVAGDPRLAAAVTFPGSVPSQQVPSAMAWGNALVLSVRDLPELYRYGISMNKLFDYLASGRWIVMGSTVPENPIADAPGLSVCCPSVDSMSTAMVQLAQMDTYERNRVAAGNVTLAQESFDYKVLSGKLATALERAMP